MIQPRRSESINTNLARRTRQVMLLRVAVFAIAVIAFAPSDSFGQSRRSDDTRTPDSRATKDTAAPTGINTLEEPADLAFRTVNGTNSSPAGRERSVSPPPHLTQNDVRIIDVRGRGNDPLISLRGYPTGERRTIPNRPGYVDVSVGMFPSARLDAGYSGMSWPFDYDARLSIDVSSGFQRNPHRRIGAALGAGYIIGEGHGIFSGGHMGADVSYDNLRYTLHALASNPTRKSSNVDISTTGANTNSGFTYDAGARYRALSIADDSLGSRETSLEGNLAIGTTWKGFAIGAQTDLRLTNLDGQSISFGRVHGYGSYSNRFMTVRAGLLFAAGANTDESTSGTIAPVGELRLFPLQGLMLIGTVTGGLMQTTLSGLSATNPFIELMPDVRHQRESIGYQLHVRVEPTRMFSLRVSGARSHYSTYAFFARTNTSRFAPQYGSAIVNRITSDLLWQVDGANTLATQVEFVEGKIADREPLQFTPRWSASLMYTHRFDVPIAIDASAQYMGERFAGTETLKPVALVNLAGRYSLTQRFDATLEIRNVLDQRYELWTGYAERGIYAAVGASARF